MNSWLLRIYVHGIAMWVFQVLSYIRSRCSNRDFLLAMQMVGWFIYSDGGSEPLVRSLRSLWRGNDENDETGIKPADELGVRQHDVPLAPKAELNSDSFSFLTIDWTSQGQKTQHGCGLTGVHGISSVLLQGFAHSVSDLSNGYNFTSYVPVFALINQRTCSQRIRTWVDAMQGNDQIPGILLVSS